MALGGPLFVTGLQSPSAIVTPGDCWPPGAAAQGTGHLLIRPCPWSLPPSFPGSPGLERELVLLCVWHPRRGCAEPHPWLGGSTPHPHA